MLVIDFFGACLGMFDHIKLKGHDHFVTFINPKLFVRNQHTNRSLNPLSR